MADYFTGEDGERVAFVPVRPDWTDNQGLLGFYNLITQRYEPTELLKLLLRASEDPENPYFLILDEMNLARVEHYFSGFLSCLESGTPVLLHDQPEELPFSDGEREYLIPPRLEIPPNLYITGTVNVDETTYMFSPKVLDRAFTLEFDSVEARAYLDLEKASSEEGFRLREGFALLPREQAAASHVSSLPEEYRELLASLEGELEPYRLHFCYRVINEISLYLKNAREWVGEDPSVLDAAFDLCLLHKVLPKLHGNRGGAGGASGPPALLLLRPQPSRRPRLHLRGVPRGAASPSPLRGEGDASPLPPHCRQGLSHVDRPAQAGIRELCGVRDEDHQEGQRAGTEGPSTP